MKTLLSYFIFIYIGQVQRPFYVKIFMRVWSEQYAVWQEVHSILLSIRQSKGYLGVLLFSRRK
jgi:hypothetical protein